MYSSFYFNQVPFAYSVYGKGETTIVLLHGFGEDSWVFEQQVHLLQNNFTVVLIDLPGCGYAKLQSQSVATDFLPLENLVFLADGIVALLQMLQLQNIVLLGHSMGGYITLAIEKKYPNCTAAFGLIHSTAYADSEEKKEVRKKGIALMEEYGGFAFLKNTIPNLFSAATKTNTPDTVNNAIQKAKYLQTKALQAYYKAMMNREDGSLVLQQTTKPVLFIAGTEDVAAPLADITKQASLPTISYIHIVENVGHMGMLENASTVTTYIQQFANSI
jgi:pimeloyl-ACP methyl ester carboxylesterase